MEIAVINKKGGVGKTPFAFSIAKDLGMFLQSNDNSCIEQIYQGKALISDEVKPLENCVYDFGGFHASGVLAIVQACDCIIVPCLPTYNSFLRTYETIDEICSINNNIILLATDFKDTKEEQFLENMLNKSFGDIPSFYFKNSKIINHAVNTGLSFMELYNENPLMKHSYANFINEYKRLIKKIKQYERK